jgi:hypothetical protein
MDSFYKFASENPWLTFFLAVVIGNTIYYSVEKICGVFTSRKK